MLPYGFAGVKDGVNLGPVALINDICQWGGQRSKVSNNPSNSLAINSILTGRLILF